MSALFSFGEWLKQRRSALLLSRDQLAQQVGCAEVTLRKIEADERRPSLSIAERLADVLELHADERTLFLQVARGLANADSLPSPIPRGAAVPPASIPTPSALPSGTVTFLFTDIAGSTQLWEQHPRPMQQALARHDVLLRAGIAVHSGVVVKSTGDGMLAVFARATDAVHASLAAQRALSEEPWHAFTQIDSATSKIQNRAPLGESKIELRVRMALHTGVTEERDGDYFGPPLNRVARLLAAGHGGQILLSLATAELVREQLPPDTDLRDLGAHRLKDLSRPEQIFQLVAPDLSVDFPPLHTLDERRTNLPAQPTALIGREQEVAAVCAQLRRPEVRLLTLTGPGGTGKTRLGLQVAAELLDIFVDGVYFVNLAPIRDANLITSAIAQTLGVTETGDQPLPERLQSYLRDKALLLLLDNFEQIVDAAPLIAELLAACPHVKVLVTSRVPLHLRGEKEFAVPPLALPPPTDDRRPMTDDQHGDVVSGRSSVVTQYAAVQLFIQRALDVQPTFSVTNDNAPAVAEICARLDGLPLAIELAAARIKLFAPEALLARLSNRLALLTGGARDLPARQQTLRNAISWSYDLLDESAQMLFARLAVFVGGCTVEAAETVCNAIQRVPGDLPLDVLDGLALLVDNSLLRREEGAIPREYPEPRFWMLETIREYALEWLAARGEAEVVRQQHAEHFLELAERAEPQLRGLKQATWLARLEAEYDNLRAALAWSRERNHGELELRLAGALWWFWSAMGNHREGRGWLEGALARTREGTLAGPHTRARARALCGAGALAQRAGDFEVARSRLEESSAISQALGDKRGRAQALLQLGIVTKFEGNTQAAHDLFAESLTLQREVRDSWGIAFALMELAWLAREQGDWATARARYEESHALFRQVGDIWLLFRSMMYLSELDLQQGDVARSAALQEEALALLREHGDRRGMAQHLHELGDFVREHGDYARAAALLEESVALWRELGNTKEIAGVLNGLGDVALYQGDLAHAAALIQEALVLVGNVASEDRLWMHRNLGRVVHAQGDYARAVALLEETTAQFRSESEGWGLTNTLHLLGAAVYAQGDATRAAALLREGMVLQQKLGNKQWIAEYLERFAALAAGQGQPDRAARLLGTAEALRSAVGTPLPPVERPAYERTIASARAQLDETTFAAAWAEGQALTLEQAIAEALNR